MAYATKEQLAANLPGVTAGGSRDADLDRVLEMAAVEIDHELDKETPFDFSDEDAATALPLLEHVNLERAADLWNMETQMSGLLLGGETPLLAPRNSWDRYANMLAPLKEQWGLA